MAPPEDVLIEAVDVLAGAQRPVIITGYGARTHMAGDIELAEALDSNWVDADVRMERRYARDVGRSNHDSLGCR